MQTSYLLLYSIVYRVFSWFTNQVDLMKCLIGYEREIVKWPCYFYKIFTQKIEQFWRQ